MNKPNQLKFVKTQITDHVFAAWLRHNDPKWIYEKVNDTQTNFTDRKGNVLAVVFYDNAACTREIYINQKAIIK